MPRVNGNAPGSPSSTSAFQPVRFSGVYVLIRLAEIVAERDARALTDRDCVLHSAYRRKFSARDQQAQPNCVHPRKWIMRKLERRRGIGPAVQEGTRMDDVVNRFA